MGFMVLSGCGLFNGNEGIIGPTLSTLTATTLMGPQDAELRIRKLQ